MASFGARVRAFMGRQTYNYYAASARYYADHGHGCVRAQACLERNLLHAEPPASAVGSTFTVCARLAAESSPSCTCTRQR